MSPTKRKKVFSVDSLPNIVIKFDAKGNISRANMPASAFFSRPADELRGAHLWTQLAARFEPDSFIAIRLAFEAGQDESQIARTSTGNRWMQIELMMDEVSGLIILSPLTIYPSDRTFVEQAFSAKLAAIESRFKALIETTNDFYYCIDPRSGQMTYASPSYEHIWGRPRESLYGEAQSALEHVLPEDRAKIAKVIPIQQNRSNFEVEYRIRRADGEVRWLWDRGYVVNDEKKEPSLYVGIATDITERKALQDRVAQEERLELIGRIASELAHDFNNILGSVRILTHLATTKADLQHISIPELTKILSALDQGASVVNSLLAAARREELLPQILAIAELLNDIQPLVVTTLGSNIELQIINDAQDCSVSVDRSAFARALLNLALNAKEAMNGRGRCTLRVRLQDIDENHPQVQQGDVKPGVFVCIEFSDNGPGMSQEVRQRAFQPFYTTKKTGSGLGLASVAGFANQSGGFAEIAGEDKHGSTIRILLPQLKFDATPEYQTKRASLKNARILLVDDDALYRDAASAYFADQGVTLRVCKDANEALDVINAEGIDLLITDLRMPGNSGLALSEQIEARGKRLPVIFLSGYVGDIDVSEAPSKAAVSKNAPMSVILDSAAKLLTERKC